MKFSPIMIVILGLVAAFVVLRIITPSPEQQMLDYYNQQNEQMMQQNQQMQMENMQMLNGMQQQFVNPYQTNPYQNGYNNPGYYQDPNSGYAYPNNGGYQQPNNGLYIQNGETNTGSDDDWSW